MNDLKEGHRPTAIEHVLVNSAILTPVPFYPTVTDMQRFWILLKKPCFSHFILKSALYKTTREKSLRVKGVGRVGGEDDPKMKPPHLGAWQSLGPRPAQQASHVLAVQSFPPEHAAKGLCL